MQIIRIHTLSHGSAFLWQEYKTQWFYGFYYNPGNGLVNNGIAADKRPVFFNDIGAVDGAAVLRPSRKSPSPSSSWVIADKFQAAWRVAAFRRQFQEPVTVNVGDKKLCFPHTFTIKTLYPYLYKNLRRRRTPLFYTFFVISNHLTSIFYYCQVFYIPILFKFFIIIF
jgi:hypothetical protein